MHDPLQLHLKQYFFRSSPGQTDVFVSTGSQSTPSQIQEEDPTEAAKFAMLWDRMLIDVGGEVQNEARARVEQSMAENPGVTATEIEDHTGTEAGEVKERQKSEDELQLWALVDMMVQSKSMIKKMMG